MLVNAQNKETSHFVKIQVNYNPGKRKKSENYHYLAIIPWRYINIGVKRKQ